MGVRVARALPLCISFLGCCCSIRIILFQTVTLKGNSPMRITMTGNDAVRFGSLILLLSSVALVLSALLVFQTKE